MLSTAEAFVLASEKGFFASELEDDLGVVGVKDALATLVGRGRIAREKISGRYLYCSPDPAEKRRQLLLRETQEEERLLGAADRTRLIQPANRHNFLSWGMSLKMGSYFCAGANVHFAARYLTCTYPCQRFANALAVRHGA